MSKECPECGEFFSDSADICPYDDASLREHSDGADELVGHVVDGRFRLERLLGQGGMGRVYEATQLSVERRVAVKLIRYRGGPDQSVRERFEREARVVSELSHPNIVRLIDFGRDEERDAPYIAMEFIDGLEVHGLLDEHRLHPNLALEIASQVAAALVEAHGADIVHRDLKTDNILLVPVSSGGFQVKVIDFGIAFPRTNSERLTNTGMICGTPRYVSPEQARGDDITPRSDLYSLGVVIFEMTTGTLPFRADSAFNVMMKHVQQKPPSLDEVLEDDQLPAGLSELVDLLLQKAPSRRPKDAREVRRRIDDIRERNEWEPIELDGQRELEEELEPWLEPAADAKVPKLERDFELIGKDDSLVFSAPDFSAVTETVTRDDHLATTDDDEAPPKRALEPQTETPPDSDPDLVGVPGQTGSPLPGAGASDREVADAETDGGETDADAEPDSGADERRKWQTAAFGAAVVAVALLGAFWLGSPSRDGSTPQETNTSAETPGAGASPAVPTESRFPRANRAEQSAASAPDEARSPDADRTEADTTSNPAATASPSPTPGAASSQKPPEPSDETSDDSSKEPSPNSEDPSRDSQSEESTQRKRDEKIEEILDGMRGSGE